MRYLFFIGLFFFLFNCLHAFENKLGIRILNSNKFEIIENNINSNCFKNNNQLFKKRPSPILRLFHKKLKDNRRLTASVLAFPFPFGIVGLHRIYLGCPPYVPVVYIGTFGGVFGALPLIDFFVLVFDKNTNLYTNNTKVFMWVN